ncbi:MAG TPA: porphobilinogen synthase, partial [Rhodospirillaceae bacterium]|nr:porphobilinogen synthase [Rhodospirillaceae bacterium]
AVRALVAENALTPADLIWPLFVSDGMNKREPVPSMPGVDRLSVDLIVDAVKRAEDAGIPAIALFPYTDPILRDDAGSEAFNPDNLVCRATRAVREACPNIMIVCDVARDPYTSHGH